jgi:hypothetical protein
VKPFFPITENGEVIVQNGGHVGLKCVPEGNPKPTITWHLPANLTSNVSYLIHNIYYSGTSSIRHMSFPTSCTIWHISLVYLFNMYIVLTFFQFSCARKKVWRYQKELSDAVYQRSTDTTMTKKRRQTGCETCHENSSKASLFPVSKDRRDEFYICRQWMCSLKRHL